MAWRYGLKWPQYRDQWDRMTIKPSREAEFTRYAHKLLDSKPRYQLIETRTAVPGSTARRGVPWYLIALLHLRESDADFRTYLGNGDPLNRPTTHVPEGRGPFATFEDGAVDALRLDGLASVPDWRLEKVLYYAEAFNGTGYHNRGLPSPYIWGGSNIQRPGKYVADGKFSPTTWDTQPGVAPILKIMMQLDSTINPIRET